MKGLRRGRYLLSSVVGLTLLTGPSGLAYGATPTPSPSASATPAFTSTPAATSEPSPTASASVATSTSSPSASTPTATPTSSPSASTPTATQTSSASTVAPTTSAPVQGLAPAPSAAPTDTPPDPNAENHISLSIKQTSASTQQAGSQFTYSVSYACSSVDNLVCAQNPTITIPLPAGYTPAMGAFSTPDSSATNTQIKSVTLNDGTNAIVVALNDLQAGSSGAFTLVFDTKTMAIPNGTKLSFTPTMTTADGHDPVVGNTATSTITASSNLRVQKTVDRIYYNRGETVTYQLSFDCRGASMGVGQVVLTDTLPAPLTLVSATAPDGVQVSTSGNSVTATFPANRLPYDCAAQDAYSARPVVVVKATVDSDAVDKQLFVNTVNGSATPIDGSAPVTSTASAQAQVEFNRYPLGSFAKTGFGPFVTEAGEDDQLVNPSYPNDGYRDGINLSSDSRWELQSDYPNHDQVANFVDPLPCLDNKVANPNGTTEYLSNSVNNLCQNPAWDVTEVSVNESVPVTLVLTDGTEVDLPYQQYRSTRPVPSQYIGRIAMVKVGTPENPIPETVDGWSKVVTGPQATLIGRADASLRPGDELSDTSYVWNFWANDHTLSSTGDDPSSLYVATASKLNLYLGDRKVTIGDPTASVQSGLGGQITTPLNGDIVTTLTIPAGVSPQQSGGTDSLLITTNALGGDGPGMYAYVYPSSRVLAQNPDGSWTLTLTYAKDDIVAKLADPTQGFNFSTGTGLGVSVDKAGSYPTSATAFVNGTSGIECVNNASVPISADAGSGCSTTGTLTAQIPVSGGSVGISKQVMGDLDTMWQSSPAKGRASSGGTGQYKMNWTNYTNHNTGNVVLYDVLPYVGDTGILDSTSTNKRKSSLTTTFAGLDQVPTTATVFYSTSTNPCRPELGIATGCDDNWTATAPADLSSVKALKVVDSGVYTQGQGFNVTFKVSLPTFDPTQVAWNTFAQASTDLVTGSPVTPTETAKVGLAAANFASLSFDKKIARDPDDGEWNLGDTVTYSLTMTNDGATPLTNTVLTDAIPDGMSFVSASGGGTATLDGKSVVWPSVPLAVGQTLSYSVVLKVNDDAPVGVAETNRAHVSSDQVPGVPTDATVCADDPTGACATVTPNLNWAKSPVRFHKTVDQSTIHPGSSKLTYTITATNPDQTTAWPIFGFSDILPEGSSNLVWSLAPGVGSVRSSNFYEPGRELYVGIQDAVIPAGATITVATVTVDVAPTVSGGSYTNAVMGSTGTPLPLTDGTCSADFVASDPRFADDYYGTPSSCATTVVTGYTLSGTVYNDANDSADLEGTEPGIPGVTVTLTMPDGSTQVTATTDANGKYQFTNLPNGDYLVSITDPATGQIITQSYKVADPTGAATSTGTSASIDNADVTDVDFGLFTPVSITVNKLGTNCDVFIATCPLSGSTFALYDADPVSGASPMSDGLTVNPADGSVFTSAKLKPGNYWLVETKAPTGHELLATPVAFTLSSTGISLTGDNGSRVTVSGDDRLTLNVLDPSAGNLPSVGGDGVLSGALLALVAGALGSVGFVLRRRNNN